MFRGAGLEPGDEAGLRDRLERLDEWRSLNRQLTEVRVIDDDLTHRELAERPTSSAWSRRRTAKPA